MRHALALAVAIATVSVIGSAGHGPADLSRRPSTPLRTALSLPMGRSADGAKAEAGPYVQDQAIWLDSLDLSKMVQRRGTPRPGRSGAGRRGQEPPPLSLGSVVYEHG